MMISEKIWKVPGAVRLGIVAIAFCILPLGFVSAQDFNAVERKLEEAIKAGDLTREDAAIMLNALKRSKKAAGGDKGQDLEAKKRRYDSYAKEIEAAVKAGKLSKDAAEKKLIAVRMEIFRNGGKKPAAKKKEAGGDKGSDGDLEAKKRRYDSYAKEIEAAVKAGKLSREEAEKKLIAIRTKMFRDADQKKTDAGKKKAAGGDKGQDLEAKKRRYLAYAKEIEAAVKAGKLSREEAEKKLIEVRTKIFRNGGKKPAAKKKEAGGDK